MSCLYLGISIIVLIICLLLPLVWSPSKTVVATTSGKLSSLMKDMFTEPTTWTNYQEKTYDDPKINATVL
jgi:hypothetical protein